MTHNHNSPQPTEQPEGLINCLGYALRFWERCPEYRLYYYPGHVINSPVTLEGTNYWLPAEDYGLVYFASAFEGLLDEHETELLKKYFNEQ